MYSWKLLPALPSAKYQMGLVAACCKPTDGAFRLLCCSERANVGCAGKTARSIPSTNTETKANAAIVERPDRTLSLRWNSGFLKALLRSLKPDAMRHFCVNIADASFTIEYLDCRPRRGNRAGHSRLVRVIY